jgi:hypothetical protein
MDYWDVTLSLTFDEPFCYFPNVFCCACISSVFLKPLNPGVFQAAAYIFSRRLIAGDQLLCYSYAYFHQIFSSFATVPRDLEWLGLEAGMRDSVLRYFLLTFLLT